MEKKIMKSNNYSKGINSVTNNTNNKGEIFMNNTMTMDVFATAVKETVEGILGNGHEVKVQEVIKNNNTHLTGLVIKHKDVSVAPTVYLEQFFEDFITGNSDIVSVAERIISVYEHGAGKVDFDVAAITDFSFCKEKICFKLINAKRNKKLLEEAPNVLLLDLAVIFYIFLGNEGFGTASITIKNNMAELWNITTEELFDITKKNTQRLFPATVRPMSSVLFGIMNGLSDHDNEFYDMDDPMKGLDTIYVCSNNSDFWGAGTVLYDDVLKGIADTSESDDIFIIPSSVHETLLIPNNAMDVSFLKQMVNEVNATAVAPEEVLSDSVYVYRADTETIELA